MKTIKIIELLNKIANGEEVPKKINYQKQDWRYNPINDYEGLYWGGCLLNNVTLDHLNDEVEILDEDEFEDIEEMDNQRIKEEWCDGNFRDYDLLDLYANKINELIKNQKKIIERLTHES